MLHIDNISKHFSGIRAVDSCSFGVEAGKITGLIGPNGAGKTTLFNIIAGFLKPTSGRISLANRNVTGFPPHQLFHHGLVRTFQIPRELGRMTVLENLMLVPPNQVGESILSSWFRWGQTCDREVEVRHKAEEVLECLHLSHLHDELAYNLSGGQKKLLELGRTMMTDAKVVLLDEPGAGVNRTLLGKLAEVIIQQNAEQGRTFCIIDHDLELVARLCDHVVVMAEGRVLAQGSMDDIRQNAAVQEAYLGTQVQAVETSSQQH